MVSSTSQRDQAYDVLRQMLILQQVPEGCRLREPEWAAKLGVNRAALREAFARLEAEGMIQRGPRTGYFVPALTPADLQEIVQLRCALECAAIDWICAAGRNVMEHLQAMHDACDELERLIQENYLTAVAEADRRFHEALIDVAGNSRLSALYRRAPLPLLYNRIPPAQYRREAHQTLDEHRTLLKAMLHGKSQRAKHLLVEQLTTHASKFSRSVDTSS